MWHKNNIRYFDAVKPKVDSILAALRPFGGVALAGGALRDLAIGQGLGDIADYDFFLFPNKSREAFTNEQYADYLRELSQAVTSLSRSAVVERVTGDIGHYFGKCGKDRLQQVMSILYVKDEHSICNLTYAQALAGDINLPEAWASARSLIYPKVSSPGGTVSYYAPFKYQIILCTLPIDDFIDTFDLGVNKIWYDGETIRSKMHFVNDVVANMVTAMDKDAYTDPRTPDRAARISMKLSMWDGFNCDHQANVNVYTSRCYPDHTIMSPSQHAQLVERRSRTPISVPTAPASPTRSTAEDSERLQRLAEMLRSADVTVNPRYIAHTYGGGSGGHMGTAGAAGNGGSGSQTLVTRPHNVLRQSQSRLLPIDVDTRLEYNPALDYVVNNFRNSIDAAVMATSSTITPTVAPEPVDNSVPGRLRSAMNRVRAQVAARRRQVEEAINVRSGRPS
jgi:hypothetical protein